MSAHKMKDRKRAFVFVDVAPGKEKKVLEKLLKYEEVMEAHIITGEYDLLAVLDIQLRGSGFASVQELAMKIVEKIRKLSDVQDTSTIVPLSSVTKLARY